MASTDYLAMMILGGVFVLFGLALFYWGWREQKSYSESLMQRRDVREFMTDWPKRMWVGAPKLGGWISLGIGVLLAIIGGVFWLID